MQSRIALLAVLGSVLVGSTALAQDTTVIRKETTTTTEVPAPSPSVQTTIEQTNSVDAPCQSTTVHKEDDAGNSKTVKKTNC
jgi:hypothetical protein